MRYIKNIIFRIIPDSIPLITVPAHSILLLLLLSFICCANSEKAGHFMNITSNIPQSMMIAEIPSWGLDHPHVLSDPNDPNQAIRKREIDYTWTWLNKTITPDIILQIRINKGEIQLLSNPDDKEEIQLLSNPKDKEEVRLLSILGNNKDDAMMISWNIDKFDITVVDGRFLALSVRVKNEVQAGVEAVFKKVINYWGAADQYRVKINIETLSSSDSGESWGRITVDGALGWYEKPVEWYKAGNEVIFAFNKVVKPPVSKVPLKDETIFKCIGGIPIEDNRSYLRFKNSNREELAKEYFQKRKNEIDELHKEENKGLGGLHYGKLPYISEPNQ